LDSTPAGPLIQDPGLLLRMAAAWAFGVVLQLLALIIAEEIATGD
jgi:hypothetical protein